MHWIPNDVFVIKAWSVESPSSLISVSFQFHAANGSLQVTIFLVMRYPHPHYCMYKHLLVISSILYLRTARGRTNCSSPSARSYSGLLMTRLSLKQSTPFTHNSPHRESCISLSISCVMLESCSIALSHLCFPQWANVGHPVCRVNLVAAWDSRYILPSTESPMASSRSSS